MRQFGGFISARPMMDNITLRLVTGCDITAGFLTMRATQATDV